MAIRLIAIDMDDTLLDRAGRVHPRAQEAVRKARRQGVRVTLATGRMFRAVRPHAELLRLELPLICYQGGLMMDRHGQQPLWCREIPTVTGQAVIDLLREQKVYYHGYFGEDLCVEKITDLNQDYARHIGVELTLEPDLRALIARRPVMEIMAVQRPAQVAVVEAALRERFGDELHINRFRNYVLEIMHPQARKELALQTLAAHLGVEQNEVMAIGDNYNDLGMLRWAGIGVAVANAEEEIKAAADWICPSNEEGGVADALERFLEY